VEGMLGLATVGKDDVIYDLGSGDGRILITAAKKFGCRGVGYEIDERLVNLSRANIAREGVGELVTIRHEDLFEADLAPATVVTLYLSREFNRRLIPRLEKLAPGSRIVSHEFDMPGVTPTQVAELFSSSGEIRHEAFLWTTPLRMSEDE
jgi:SAM-dependent methyltransferase